MTAGPDPLAFNAMLSGWFLGLTRIAARSDPDCGTGYCSDLRDFEPQNPVSPDSPRRWPSCTLSHNRGNERVSQDKEGGDVMPVHDWDDREDGRGLLLQLGGMILVFVAMFAAAYAIVMLAS